ncbi:hypothetical protein FD754_018919 [Muntiacus muntjak]|uniref:Protein TMEM155 n=1 Tax=Muntiacus muntjak TaxID=9888 RepID=A0A5N3UYS0_MUNMU|nr:hypothetical protein FD754_018919 [Muntiacus muntjak]
MILIVSLISKLENTINLQESFPRVCHALAFLGMTRCQDLFLVHLQGWKLGTRFQDGGFGSQLEDGGSPRGKQGMPV